VETGAAGLTGTPEGWLCRGVDQLRHGVAEPLFPLAGNQFVYTGGEIASRSTYLRVNGAAGYAETRKAPAGFSLHERPPLDTLVRWSWSLQSRVFCCAANEGTSDDVIG